jgi:hypothetical protein
MMPIRLFHFRWIDFSLARFACRITTIAAALRFAEVETIYVRDWK